MYRSRLAFSLAMATLAAILACSPRFVRVTFQRTYGGPRGDCGNSVLQTADEGYAVAGFTESFGLSQEDFYLVRVDKNGDTVWTRTY
ncbi:hypothetical protein FJY70_03230, partial [candidate division WOR-3 bacterium]|nr:hypothetical protein [candidate division WOR-3 bacterium]